MDFVNKCLKNDKTPFFLLKKKNETDVLLNTGSIVESDLINNIPNINHGKTNSVSIIPFSQIKERGFPAHSNGEKIKTMLIEKQCNFSVEEILDIVENTKACLANTKFDTTRDEYKTIIESIIKNEIGNGEGSNFVISRGFLADLECDNIHQAVLSIWRSLLVNEIGAYWTFVFFDGNSYIIGATPERHISQYDSEILMNPISGTFRKSSTTPENFSTDLINFLHDPKEIFELFMVTDEELKIMCRLCDKGGAIVGPLLKEMANLVHTEYVLIGNSDKSVSELLQQSMFAPTVTGSPVQSASKVIKRYEKESRGHYAATIALITRDENGKTTLDSPITIRTLEITKEGKTRGRVGATLVQGSDPESEVCETESKIAGVLKSIEKTGSNYTSPKPLLNTVDNEKLQIILQKRNMYLSRFWFEIQSLTFCKVPELCGKKIIIIDAEDDFSSMLARIIGQMGANVSVVHYSDYSNSIHGNSDIIIPGPGPGNPEDLSDIRIQKIREIIVELNKNKKPFFAECLSHQILCSILGFPIVKKQNPLQGVQKNIKLFGNNECVGFYNTFAGQASENAKYEDYDVFI